jgi:hypothetical protein
LHRGPNAIGADQQIATLAAAVLEDPAVTLPVFCSIRRSFLPSL